MSPGVSENRCQKVKGHKPPLQQIFDSISSDDNIHLLSIGLAVSYIPCKYTCIQVNILYIFLLIVMDVYKHSTGVKLKYLLFMT